MSAPGKLRGWQPSARQPSDRIFKATHKLDELPASASLWDKAPSPYLQGQLGSCLPHALCTGLYIAAQSAGSTAARIGSFLFLYRGARLVDGTVDQDAGSTYKSAEVALRALGLVAEVDYPYSDEKTGDPNGDGAATDPYRREPSMEIYRAGADARLDVALHWIDSTGTEGAIAVASSIVGGKPVCVGLMVDQAFVQGFSPGTVVGAQDMTALAGGHAMTAVAYRHNSSGSLEFLLKNWWGTEGPDFASGGGCIWVSEAFMDQAEKVTPDSAPALEETL